MDRNIGGLAVPEPPLNVALRKESVDRNSSLQSFVYSVFQSLSARRAWIEMLDAVLADVLAASLSARRAWIEISRR